MASKILYFICVCFVLTTAELLGPETKKDVSNAMDSDDTSEETVENTKSIDAEDVKNTLKNVNSEYVEVYKFLNTFITSKKQVAGDNPEGKKMHFTENELEKMQQTVKWFQKNLRANEGLLQLEVLGNEIEKMDEDPQDILDNLPALDEDEEEELTPELREAKELYDEAVKRIERRTPDLVSSIQQIKQAAERGYGPAKISLAWSYLFGEGVEHDIMKAKMIFEKLSEEGIADAHAGMGFLYATGIGVPVSQARALVHYTMGALGDSDYAQMALAYRYWSGVTVTASCPKAMELYMKVAAKVASAVTLSGGPAVQRTRLADEAESGGALDSDLIEYYQLLAEKGDVQAQVGLGQLHFQGGRGVTLDVSKARHYFSQAAKTGNAVANAFLGKIYLEGGDGIRPDNETALRYFRKAAELNNPVGQSGLGLMYLQGRGVPKDTATAFKYFAMAANQGWVEGQLNLGFLYFGGIGVRRDFKQANKYFSLASQSGHVLALFHLGQLHAQGLGVLRSCTTAVELFKNVCERGRWSGQLMRAHGAWRARDADSAFMQYLALAERGYELAQTNAAYLLDEGEVQLFGGEERWRRALQLWSRGAAQGHAPARVKLGDYHYYGLGTEPDLQAAAHHYRIASEHLHSAQATFNLGYMHERGLGLVQDAHLAKRCYDLAADASPDARLPASLASARLAAAAALQRLAESPLAMLFVSSETALYNWDMYLITTLAGALGLVMYLRRPAEV